MKSLRQFFGWSRRDVSRQGGRTATQGFEGNSISKGKADELERKAPFVELRNYREQFVPRFRKTGSNYEFSAREGYVMTRDFDAGVVPFRVDGTEEDGEVAWRSISVGDTVYCKITTDEHDKLTGTPAIQVGGSPTSTPAKPKIGDSEAVAGEYYYPLFSFSIVDGKALIILKSAGGPIEHYPTRMWFENIDGEEANGDVHNIVQDRGDDVANVKTIVQYLNTDRFNLLADPNPLGVFVKNLGHRSTESERGIVLVDVDGRTIEVQGTGLQTTFANLLKNVVIRDGLIASADDVDGWSGTITWSYHDSSWSSSPNLFMEFTFVSGVLTGVKINDGLGGALATVASGGSATFHILNS